MSDPFIEDDEPQILPGESPTDSPLDLPTDAPVPIPSDVPFDPPGDLPPTDDQDGVPLQRPPVERDQQPETPLVPS